MLSRECLVGRRRDADSLSVHPKSWYRDELLTDLFFELELVSA
ncbi:hypothetical protein [Streptomyces sp. NPDC086010]